MFDRLWSLTNRLFEKIHPTTDYKYYLIGYGENSLNNQVMSLLFD